MLQTCRSPAAAAGAPAMSTLGTPGPAITPGCAVLSFTLAAGGMGGSRTGASLERVITALGRRGLQTRQVRPTSYMASCPVHEENTRATAYFERVGFRPTGETQEYELEPGGDLRVLQRDL